MPTQEQITINERRKYLKRMLPRYRLADPTERSRLLTEMHAVTTLERKSLIRLLNSPTLERQPRQRQRGATYDHPFDDALRVLAQTLDYVCAERFQPTLLNLAQHLDGAPPPRTPPASPVCHVHVQCADEAQPGHFETDWVHHGSDTVAGDYVYTLPMVDVATGWSERVAVFGRSQRAMKTGFRRIQARLPFPLLKIHPNNGSEFLNHHLRRFFRTTVQGVTLSRSRPYQKNDNRLVEQKNHTLVRAFFGEAHLLAHQRLLDELYDQLWLYYNFFQPVLHLVEKQRDDRAGVIHFRRRWDVAQTPLERLCATSAIDDACRARLGALRAQTNPRQLRRGTYPLREPLFDLPLARRPQDRWLILDDDLSDLS